MAIKSFPFFVSDYLKKDFGLLFPNKIIFVLFGLEQVEFRMLIPTIPLPGKFQKEYSLKEKNGTVKEIPSSQFMYCFLPHMRK